MSACEKAYVQAFVLVILRSRNGSWKSAAMLFLGITVIIIIIIVIVIIVTITSAFCSSLVLVTVFPQRGIEQGEHVCAVMFNARNL
jgi:hypothetical protein